MNAVKHAWQHDRETGEHFLPVDESNSWKVYKTAAGDYACTLHDDDVGYGGEVEYFDTLRQAKAYAEKQLATQQRQAAFERTSMLNAIHLD